MRRPPLATTKNRLFVFSSHDQAAFQRLSASLTGHLDDLGPLALRPDFLADLAHTLAVARSGLAWKASCVAASTTELREYLSTVLAANDATPTGTYTRTARHRTPRVGYVFTGQGAQWARMGVDLLSSSPVFAASVACSAAHLTDLGCPWDPVVELERGPETSRLALPEISQPITTVLQIAIVDELAAWGVKPARVIGHSSGEIAAAYCAGALSHRDAIAVAYFRGKVSAGVKVAAPDLRGGMMAVGASKDEVEEVISSMASPELGQVTVACINSPSSVTISGNTAALSALSEILEQRQIFCRRLKVEVAYHSQHMLVVSEAYTAYISDVEPDEGNEGAVAMVSSVTGEEVAPEMMGAYYWVRNLLSPVLFAEALKELLTPEDMEGSEPEVDVLVEIGPHSALMGPIEQCLSHANLQDKVTYIPTLQRGNNSSECVLSLAQALFHLGIPLSIQAINGDSSRPLLTDLPPYPWKHDKLYNAVSRMHRDLVMRQWPRRSLIGAQMPVRAEGDRTWRGFVRLDDEPWLRGHKIGETVLMPGAGIVSMAIEAVQQLAQTGRTPHAIRLRDVSFYAALALTEDAATEVLLNMRPHLIGTAGQTPSAWWEFTVSSSIGSTAQLRDNCSGLITIDYSESRSSQMAHEDASIAAQKLAEYHQHLEDTAAAPCSKEAFYTHFAKSGFSYSPTFQGVESVQMGAGKTTFGLRVTDLGQTFSAGQMPGGKRPFLMHGATLDAVFQAWVSSTYDARDGSMGFGRPFAPTHVGSLEIAMDVAGEEGYVMPGFYTSERRGFNDLSANCVLFDEALQKVYLTVTDFRVAELDVDDAPEQGGSSSSPTAPSDITYEIRWDYAMPVLQTEEVARLVAAADHGLAMLVRLALHQNPAASVVELAADFTTLPQSVLNRPQLAGLTRWATPVSQLRHSVLNRDGSDSVGDHEMHGQAFMLGDQSSPLPPSADVLVVPEQLSTVPDFMASFERFIGLANPAATVLLAVEKDGRQAIEVLASSGWTRIVDVPSSHGQGDGDAMQIMAYKKTPEPNNAQANGHSTNQDSELLPETIILQPSSPSPHIRDFSMSLQQALAAQGLSSSSIKTWDSYTAPAADQAVISLLELDQPMLQFLDEADFHRIKTLILTSGRLLWITAGDDPALHIVDGLARCIASEIAGSLFQTIHLNSRTPLGPQLAARIATARSTADMEFREDGDGLLKVSRVLPSPEGNDLVARHLENSTRIVPLAQQEIPLRLTIGRPGLLDTLHFVKNEHVLGPLGDEEVEIEVKATGLNFKDVMAAMGLVRMSVLGLEASGVVVQAGEKAARRFKPGDRVAVFATGSFATTTRANHQAVASIPNTMSFEEAAAIPIVHTTAYHSLVNLARLRKGQSILIHAAAGGVGQAAVQIAKYLGLIIYATVGSEDKRSLLCERFDIDEAHVLHSRDASFVKGIARLTGGRGVDCVLNSLSGELLRASWGCLAPFGTFIEIGLRDITNNMRLDMRPFTNNTTFTSCNMATLALSDLAVVLDKTFDLVRHGHLSAAYPLTTMPIGQVGEAFRTMQQGKHRGKIVVSLADPTATGPVFHNCKDSLRLDPNVTYLLAGGLGGLGRTLAREFVACGARHLAFLSRSGAASPSARSLLAELTASGAVTARAYLGDVTDAESTLAALQQCEAEMPPVRGVVQLAMVLRDVVFEKMTHAEWTGPLRPKVEGTLNLLRYFDEASRPLDFFVATSSVSGIWGYPSQAAYAAGNTFEDAVAHYRRARGMKAVSVNLGIISGVGVISELGAQPSQLETWERVLGIREPVFVALMKSVIAGQLQSTPENVPPQVTTGLGSANVWAAHRLPRPYYLEDPRFGAMAVQTVDLNVQEGQGKETSKTGPALAARLSEASTIKQAADIVTEALVAKTALILQMPASEVDPSLPLYRYGVDSLVAIEVRNWITREMKANIALLEIMAAVPIKDFALKFTEQSKLVAV